MPADFRSILPAVNSTPWEKAVERASGERWDALDIDIIRRSRDPWTCPEHLLNFLAYDLSIDLWDKTWQTEIKRAVIADWYRLHARKGTQWGISRHVEIIGGRVVKVVAPPQKAFPGTPLSPDERQAFLDLMPQVRIYPYYARGVAFQGAFTGPRSRVFCGAFYPKNHSARERYRRFARLYEPRDGSLIDLTFSERVRETFTGQAVEYEEIVLPKEKGAAFYAGRARGRIFLGRRGVPERTFRVSIDRPYDFSRSRPQDRTWLPDLATINLYPEHVFEQGTARPRQFFAGRCLTRAATNTLRSTAWQRIYERFYRHDPARTYMVRRGQAFAGHMRLGMKPYHAELTVETYSRRHRRAFYTGRPLWRGMSFRRDRDKLDGILGAVRIAKALRDKVLVNTITHRHATFGDRILLDDGVRFGDMIRSL